MVLIVSWNVAGLGTTVQRINKNYGQSTATTVMSASTSTSTATSTATSTSTSTTAQRLRKYPARSAVLRAFLERHRADIVCLQEAKIPLVQLRNRSEPLQCAHIEGYESFWGCCVDADKKGFNGVVTYCRTGTVVSADARPLQDRECDDQGRCVMTDHGSFVVFNVYAPAGGGNPLSYKMKFLNRLRRAMQHQRDVCGKRVVLVGDLNISLDGQDQFWASRCLNVNEICRQVEEDAAATAEESQMPRWKIDLAKMWPRIERIVGTKEAVEATTTNPRTGETFQKYRLAVTIPVDNNNGNSNRNKKGESRQVFLGKYEEHPDHCHCYFDFQKSYFTDADTEERIMACDENIVAVSTVAELMGKLVGIEWDEKLQKQIAATDAQANPLSPPRRWLDEGIIKQDGMVDAFRHFYPDAEGRFTIWDQFRNRRYANAGARIDFTLIDATLLPYLQRGDVTSLRCGCAPDRGLHHPNSDEAALCAATFGGKYVAVSFEGGGIVESSQATLDSQFGTPHTGMIYTPPSFSDHIAVSVLLDDAMDQACASRSLQLQVNDKAVREAQPHKRQQTIKDIFGVVSSSSNETAKKLTIPAKRKGIMDSFLSTKSDSSRTRSDGGEKSEPAPSKVAKACSISAGAGGINDRLPLKKTNGHPSVLSFFSKKSG